MSRIRKLISSVQSHGVMGTLAIVFKRPLKSTPKFREKISGKYGMEVGGPSPFFRTFLPIYDCIALLDNCVFANTTIWEGEVHSAFHYYPGKPPGRNYIAEGTDLRQFGDGSYDFLLSCHNLEHIANPIKALKEWVRVLKPNGAIVLVLPDGRRTFDHRRFPTPVSHMLSDYQANIGEEDLTHLEEILTKHDLRRDPSAGTLENFRKRSIENFSFRCLHHHVFNPENVRELLETVGLRVCLIEKALPFHIAALAIKRSYK